MKHFLVALVLLLGAGFVHASENVYDYSHCVPHCVTFEQIGEKHFAAARSAGGQLVALTEVGRTTGILMAAAKLAPVAVSVPGPHESSVATKALSFYDNPWDSEGPSCTTYRVETETVTDRTATEVVTHIYVRTYCDGKLISSTVVTVRVQVATPDEPN